MAATDSNVITPATDEEILALARDYAVKRKAFLAAHSADYNSPETAATYDTADEACEEMFDAIEHRAQLDPDWVVRLFTP